MGVDANDGLISAGEGLSFILDVPSGVRIYALVTFPNGVGHYFIDSNTLLNQQLVSVSRGELQVADNLCSFMEGVPALKVLEGPWLVAFLTVPDSISEFLSLDELDAYINNGGAYHFGSYTVRVYCWDW